jgi:uncharacterized membrane protein YphA (DoxX/SURF4 family)
MIKNLLGSKWVNLFARIAIGAIFVYASIDKIRDPHAFARLIDGYRVLPENLVAIVAVILPFLELICGVLLIIGLWVLPALVWVGIMLVIFTLGMIQAYFRGLAIECGCFSTTGSSSGVGVWTIIRDLLIILVWLKAFLYYKRSLPTERPVSA